jgi:trans-2,3-dihydro-3-hydroxyanthranilate isomerase
LKSCEALANIDFDTAIWKQLKHTVNNAFIYIFTIHDVEGGDVKGRMFAPETGIMEDPATGSANGPLVAYLTHYDVLNMPIKSLQGYEMGRPSQLYLNTEVDANRKITAVKVGGKSVLTGKGMHFL